MKALIAIILAGAALAGCGFGGETEAGPAAALTPPESSWVPGQATLPEYPEFAGVFTRATDLAEKRDRARERALERIKRAKIAARKRADAEARRRYLEAKRRAEAAYRRALREAARKRREQQERLRRIKERIARLKAEREKKLRVYPGEECKLENVRKRFDCRRGRLPDPATERK